MPFVFEGVFVDESEDALSQNPLSDHLLSQVQQFVKHWEDLVEEAVLDVIHQ